MDNHQLAKEELKAIKVFNPDQIEAVGKRYYMSLKKAFAIWLEYRCCSLAGTEHMHIDGSKAEKGA